MAFSSSTSLPTKMATRDATVTPNPTPMTYEAFKPRFPVDPFAAAAATQSARGPWTLNQDNLPSLRSMQSERRVILILGQPSTSVLEPLFHSLHLSSSLLIIASHRPPVVPSTAQPAIRVLRLTFPIAVENNGAPRLVALLERAEQVARLWRKFGGDRVQELIEDTENPDEFDISKGPKKMRFSYTTAPISSTPVLPDSKVPPRSKVATATNTTPPLTRHNSSREGEKNSALRRRSTLLPPSDPNQRPFDVILNFLPNDIPDKIILKNAILVTTLTRPYFVAASESLPPPTLRYRSADAAVTRSDTRLAATKGPTSATTRKWSLFRGSSLFAASSVPFVNDPRPSLNAGRPQLRDSRLNSNTSMMSAGSVASLLTLRKPRIIHLLSTPPSKPAQFNPYASLSYEHARLIRSIEAFLLSFSVSFNNNPYSPQQSDDDMERATPYIVPTSALCDVICLSPKSLEGEDAAVQMDWSLAELLLSGALEEPLSGPLSDVAKGKQKDGKGVPRRAWIAGVNDVVVREGNTNAVRASPEARKTPTDLTRVITDRAALPPTPDEDETTDSEELSPVVNNPSSSRTSVELEQRADRRKLFVSGERPPPSSSRHGLLTPPASEEAVGSELDSRLSTPEPTLARSTSAVNRKRVSAGYATHTPKVVDPHKEREKEKTMTPSRRDSRTHARRRSSSVERPSLPHPAMKKAVGGEHPPSAASRPASRAPSRQSSISKSNAHSPVHGSGSSHHPTQKHTRPHMHTRTPSHTQIAMTSRSVRPYSNNNGHYRKSSKTSINEAAITSPEKKTPKWMFWKSQSSIAVA